MKESAARDKIASLSIEKRRLLEQLLQKKSSSAKGVSSQWRESQSGPVRAPASGTQQRLWFIDKLEGSSAAYHLPITLRLRGELDCAALQAALEALVSRHESLRTVFPDVEGEPVQEIRHDTRFVLQRVDLSNEGSERLSSELHDRVRSELESPFDLRAGPLIRGLLLRLSRSEHVLLIVVHHVVFDGWSTAVFIRELGALYRADEQKQAPTLAALRIQYADYTHWQRDAASDDGLRERLQYWKEHLHAAPALSALPTDRPRPPLPSHRGSVVDGVLDSHLAAQLKALSRRFECTLAMTLLAAWSLLLSRLSGQDDVVLGIPVANRRREEFETVIGFFANTIAVRMRTDDDLSLADLVRRAKQTLLAAYANQEVPFEHVVEAVQPERNLSHSPIFQSLFDFQSGQLARIELPGLILTEERAPLCTAQFDLTMALRESPDGIAVSLNYATDLFDESTVVKCAGYFERILRELVRDARQKANTVQFLGDAERHQLLTTFNATHRPYPRDRLIHELFEAQVERTPHEVAVVSGSDHLTYRQLNARANRLASYLRQKGANPDSFVGLCMDRGIDMVVGLLGILKSGSAYLPLDPSYPQHRLEYMLEDTTPIAVLTQEHLRDRLPAGQNLIEIGAYCDDIAQCAATNPGRASHRTNSSSLAYVIYTSGSTGRPKGVAIEHRNAVNMICWAQSAMSAEVFEHTLQSTSLNFDLSVYECFVPLASGGCLRVVQNALALASEPDVAVTLINTVPSAISSLLDAGGIPASTRVVNLAGEALKGELVERIFTQSAVECVSNLYGPSETTTYSTWIAMLREEGFNATVGRPIANTQIYILDARRQLVPVGMVGEIYIGGDGVARGYLNREELTAERFIRDPFHSDPQARMYRTGDLGRWRGDGTIEYLGRNDHQVKIRGFRIELAEIEMRLVRHAQVKEAVVLAREDVPGDKRLVAYVVAREQTDKPSIAALRTHAKETLPEYMVPSAFVQMEQMPLTPNGKLDREALPAPHLDAYISRAYEAPQGELEEILAVVWQELLHLERVGRNDSFFELGGHSLLIVQMKERLRRAGLSVPLRCVFDNPKLTDLASALTSEVVEQFEVPPGLIPPACERITPEMLPLVELQQPDIDRIAHAVPGGASNIEDIYPLVPLQEGILFHHLLDEERGDAYVLPFVLRVASRGRVDELIAAVQTVIDRHAVLRTSVLWEQLPCAVQVVNRQAVLPVGDLCLASHTDGRVQVERWLQLQHQRLDIRRAPLMRMRIGADPQSDAWYVVLQLHHIMLDHIALEIIITEIVAILEGHDQVSTSAAPYRNHVAQVLAHARTCDDHVFFDAKLGDVEEPTAPFGLMNVHGDGSEIDEGRQQVDAALATRIREQARKTGVSAATLFHAAWGLVVAHTSGRHDVVFGTVLLGRLRGPAGIERTLGMFINTLPLRLRLDGATARTLVERTQRELVELLGHEHASLADAQRRSGIVGSAPLFSAILNYRHTVPDAHAQLSGAAGIEAMSSPERTNYPITMSVDDLAADGFSMATQTDRRIDPQRLLDCLRTALESLVDALERGSDAPALSLSILSSSEHKAREALNATATPYAAGLLVHELVEEQAAITGETIAVRHGDRSLTYAELNRQANRLGRYLRALGIGPDELVGVCFDRCMDMVVGMLGILKAGGAYLPLDPSYPAERLQHMLEDASPRVILTQAHLQSVLPATDAEIIDIETAESRAQREDDGNLARVERTQIEQPLVYVIYTSGSTGAPKGTAMPHRAMTNLIQWHRRHSRLGQPRRTLQFAALSFDVAFQEIFSTLATGGTLMLLDESIRRDARALLELLQDQEIERLFLPPLMLQSLAEFHEDSTFELQGLREIITAGEQLRVGPETAALFIRLEDCELHNHYGPTETHVVTALTLHGDPLQWPVLPTIGKPIANTRIYVLDAQGRPVPWGVPGEIHIAGANVAQGYLHRRDMTEARFLRDPFVADPLARMYKSGDLGRWNRDGNVEFLGRNDDQVKIRGFRIELGEVETQLAKHAHVREAAVVAREGTAGERRLVAYVTVHDGIEASVGELRGHLKALLPDHMVPSAFVVLESLPLTPSGKLNRRVLPAPGEGAYAVRAFEPPQGDTEQAVAGIWQTVLDLDRVGRDEDFFELGGHSLLALKALSRMNKAFGCSLRVTDLYKSSTVRNLAARISGTVLADDFVDLAREATLDARIVPLPQPLATSTSVVLLTGATGFVGRFLLAQLLSDTSAKIYCLVRAKSQRHAEQRLRTTSMYWDLWRDEFESRIVAVNGDLRLPRLGMDEITWQRLSREVDCIHHCATSMNHLETYAMAKAANVDASRELLVLATSEVPKRINFISTTGVFGASASDPPRTVTEQTPIDFERHRQSNGYLASKWVAEKIFMIAAERGIACNIFRLGLVWADTERGRFDELQAVYRVLKSCLLSEYGIEDYRYPMAPTPVNYAARAVVFLAERHRRGGGIFHISSAVNLLAGVFEHCNLILDRPLELLPYYRWLGEIKRLHQAGESLSVVPLIDSLFAMDEASLHEHERSNRSVAHIHFDLTRTHEELERGGIIAPAVDDELLKCALHDMVSRDEELRPRFESDGSMLGAPARVHGTTYAGLT